MKYGKILMIIALSALLFSCDRELPYDLDGVTKSVIIDIKRSTGSDIGFVPNSNVANLSVTMKIHKFQGDYSMMREAQLLCVYTPAGSSSPTQAVVVREGITTFPIDIPIDLAHVSGLLGITAPQLGDKLEFTPNVVLVKNNEVIPGWTALTGFNNRVGISAWPTDDGMPFSYRASFEVFVQFDPAIYNGPATCVEDGYTSSLPTTVEHLPAGELPATIPPGMNAADLFGLKISPLSEALGGRMDGELKVWVNRATNELVVPDQVVLPNYNADHLGGQGVADFKYVNAQNARADTYNRALVFTVGTDWGGASVGTISYVITMN